MSTAAAVLDVTQYVRINSGYTTILLQVHGDPVRIVLSESKPTVENTAFHLLDGSDASLPIPIVDTNVWALATSDNSSLIVTESADQLHVSGGKGELSVDVWGHQITTQPYSLFESTFTFALSSRKWLVYRDTTEILFDSISPDTHVRTVSGALQMNVDATVPHVKCVGRHCPKYQSNREYRYSTAMIVPDYASDATQRWGLMTVENGVYFEAVSGVLYACRMSGGVVVARNAITLPVGIDITKGNVYDIRFQYRGVGSYEFYINLKKVYTMPLLGTLTVLSMENPALPAHYELIRGTTDVSLVSSCVDVNMIGGTEPREQYNSAYAENVTTGAANQPILAIYNPLLIGGETNTRSVSLDRVTVDCDKKAVFKVWSTRNPAALTGGTFLQLNDSYMMCDSPDVSAGAVRVTALNTALCQLITTVSVLAGQSKQIDNPDPGRIHFDIVRGDYIVVTCSTSTSTADCVIELGEEI